MSSVHPFSEIPNSEVLKQEDVVTARLSDLAARVFSLNLKGVDAGLLIQGKTITLSLPTYEDMQTTVCDGFFEQLDTCCVFDFWLGDIAHVEKLYDSEEGAA